MDVTKARRASDIRRVADWLRGERGFAVPTTLVMMLVAFAIVSVGVVAASNTQQGTIRDRSSKAALQLAETGIDEAILRYNHLTPPASNPCSPVGGTRVGDWCQVASATDSGGGSYTYAVQVHDSSNPDPQTNGGPAADGSWRMPEDDQGNIQLKVVATGTSGGATRRVLTDAKSFSTNVFADYQVKAGEDIILDQNAEIHAGTAAGGDIYLNSEAKQCGPASVGNGRDLHPPSSSAGGHYSDQDCTQPSNSVAHEDISLPPYEPGDIAINNNNTRLFALDPVSGNAATACWNGLKANGTSGTCGPRHLDIGTNSDVTLGGSKYFFCKLTTSSNSALLVSGGRKVTIIFDTPENCGYPAGAVQLDMNQNSRITSNDGTPVELIFLGDSELHLSSNTDLDAACEQNIIVYAPLSDIVLNSNSTYCGALAGRTIHLASQAQLWTRSGYDLTLQPALAYYQSDEFVECRSAAATAPNFTAGC